MMDTTAGLHYYTLYSVPFDKPENSGMRWNYSLVRLPSPSLDNVHVVQVTSSSNPSRGRLEINLRTNLDGYESSVSPDKPVILYAEVRSNQLPVVNVRVEAEIQGTNTAGIPVPGQQLRLLDSGTGDPDMFTGDGVYSRYFTRVQEEGRYTVTLRVSSSRDSPAWVETGSDKENLGEFTRISGGYSFRVSKLRRGSQDSFPPSRVLDLSVDVLTSTQQLEFSWTAPGDDYDEGKPTSYQLFCAEDPTSFYEGSAMYIELVESLSGVKPAGEQETHRIHVKALNKNLYYGILGVDDQGNAAPMSNIVKAYMPQPFVVQRSGQSVRENGQLREGLFNPFQVIKEPNKIIMYVVVGVVTVVIFTFLVVMMIMIVSRKLSRRNQSSRAADEDTFSKDNDLVRFSSVDLNINEKLPPYLPGPVTPYIEYIPDTNYCSYDKLIPGSKDSLPNQSMQTFMDPYTSTSAEKVYSPIYSKPVPRNQRAVTRPDTEQSPIKSILKKPREDGDGEADPPDLMDRGQPSPVNWKPFPPPTLPKPPLSLDITEHSRPEGSVRDLDIVAETSTKVRNCTQV